MSKAADITYYLDFVSRSKTEYVCDRKGGKWNNEVKGVEVEKVLQFRYLGSTVQSSRKCGLEVKKRVQAGCSGRGC